MRHCQTSIAKRQSVKMKPDLMGYVLNILDSPTRASVEAYLRNHAEAQAEVEALRQAFEPLSWDSADAPPPGLAERTLQQVPMAHAPDRPKVPVGVRVIPWRRLLEVAAVLVILATPVGLGISWIGRIRIQQPGGEPNATQVIACKDNLHKLFVALCAYGETHNRKFPNVAAALEPPRNAGGLVFSIPQDSNLLPSDIKLVCPGASSPALAPAGLNDVKAMDDGAYQHWAKTMQNGYAYSLGYQQDGQIVGPHLEDGKPTSLMPLMADSPPPNPLQGGHSLNHGGSGQNVLYGDGHVAFCHSRNVGYNLDDIYLNRANKVAAGVDWRDAVLTSGTFPP